MDQAFQVLRLVMVRGDLEVYRRVFPTFLIPSQPGALHSTDVTVGELTLAPLLTTTEWQDLLGFPGQAY